ncbi:MAG TPA: hypothetical protein VHP11_00785, partial [Tepidisphaeraceae bacterium]|nr:hypothetical protein [Tepidisphaeraceae bacterium]
TQVKIIVPTSQGEGLVWRYTFEKPADGWFKPDFDAAAWKQGPAGFGTKGTPGSVVRTEWKTSDIWLRREFELPEISLDNLCLMLHHDEGAEVYINGILAAKTSDYTTEYQEADLTKEAKAALKPGKNTIAIHCHQTQGGQYIDCGMAEVK